MPSSIQVTARLIGTDAPTLINEAELLAAVHSGTEAAYDGAQQRIYIEHIEYVSSDTPDYSVYYEMAEAIMRAAILSHNAV
jgi:hypothetical protein